MSTAKAVQREYAGPTKSVPDQCRNIYSVQNRIGTGQLRIRLWLRLRLRSWLTMRNRRPAGIRDDPSKFVYVYQELWVDEWIRNLSSSTISWTLHILCSWVTAVREQTFRVTGIYFICDNQEFNWVLTEFVPPLSCLSLTHYFHLTE